MLKGAKTWGNGRKFGCLQLKAFTMTNLQLFREISALPPYHKQYLINYIKRISSIGVSTYDVETYLTDSHIDEPNVIYRTKNSFQELLLSGPTFSEKQVQKIIDSRKL